MKNTATKKRANGKRSSAWITKHKRLAIYLRDKFLCNYCGRDLKEANPREINLDHIQPRSAGGSNRETNLITACLSCNSKRQDKSVQDYATGGAIERITQQIVKPLNIELAKALIAGTTGKGDR